MRQRKISVISSVLECWGDGGGRVTSFSGIVPRQWWWAVGPYLLFSNINILQNFNKFATVFLNVKMISKTMPSHCRLSRVLILD